MRAVVQRVLSASVSVEHAIVGEIGAGLLVLLGVSGDDSRATAARLAAKILALRIFEDSDGKMNLSLPETDGSVLCVSQFTLYADVRRGNRPSFAEAAKGDIAGPLYEQFCAAIEAAGVVCRRGVFGADMQVQLVIDGPVTIIIDSAGLEAPRRG